MMEFASAKKTGLALTANAGKEHVAQIVIDVLDQVTICVLRV